MLAQEEARRIGRESVGTEQILLGLIAEATGFAAKILKSEGANLKAARTEVEKIVGRKSPLGAEVEISFTPRTKKVLELSAEQADDICTEHLLWGIIREGEGIAIRVLENLRVDLDALRTQLVSKLNKTEEDRNQMPENLTSNEFRSDSNEEVDPQKLIERIFDPEGKNPKGMRQSHILGGGMGKCAMGNYSGAIALYNEGLETEPENEKYYYGRGDAKRGLGDYIGALADYNEALRLNPNYFGCYHDRGLLKSALGDYKGAIDDYSGAIKNIKSKNDNYHNDRADAYLKLGNYRGAIADLTEAIEVKPENDDYYFKRGLARAGLEDYKGAIADYNEAIRINPKNEIYYSNRGSAKSNIGDHEGAIADYFRNS